MPRRVDLTSFLKTTVIYNLVVLPANLVGTLLMLKVEVVNFKWTLKYKKAFKYLKTSIYQNIICAGDLKWQYHLLTNMSKTGTGGILFQLKKRPAGMQVKLAGCNKIDIIIFLSSKLTLSQSKYGITEWEALTLLIGLDEVKWLV